MAIVRSGYTDAGPNKNRRYGYHRAHWRTLRTQRLSLDGYRCTIQLPGCTTTATTVDLNPALNGNHDQATLTTTRSACAHCHGRIDGSGARHPFTAPTT